MHVSVSLCRLSALLLLRSTWILLTVFDTTTIRGAEVQAAQGWFVDGIELSSIQFSPDDTLVTSAGRIWSPTNRHALASFPAGAKVSLFSPSGEWLASDNNQASEHRSLIRLWRLNDQSLVQSFVLTNRTITCGAFSPDGAFLAAGDQEEDRDVEEPGRITIWR